MKISVTEIDAGQYDQWNRFVDLSPQGDVFCYSWWLDAVTKSRFKIFVIKDKDEIVAGMPLAYDRFGRINEPPLTRTLGVLFKPQPWLSVHRQLSNQRNWLNELLHSFSVEDVVQFCTHHNFNDWLPFRWKGLKQTTRYTYLVDYSAGRDLWGNLNRGKKNFINRAVKNGLSVEETDDIRSLYNLVTMSYGRQGLKFHIQFDDFNSLNDAVVKNGRRLILKAIDSQNCLHAAIYLVYDHRSAYYLISGSDPENRTKGGHTLVLWEALKYFSDKVDFFNFGGSNIESIESHFRSFGGRMVPYYHIYNDQMIRFDDIGYHFKQIGDHFSSVYNLVRNRTKRILS